MRVQTTLGVLVTEPGKAVYFERDPSVSGLITDAHTAASADTFSLPGTGQAVTLSLGNVVGVRGVFLEADGPVQLVLDGSAYALSPSDPGRSCRIYAEMAVFNIQVSASELGSSVSGRYVVWGSGQAE